MTEEKKSKVSRQQWEYKFLDLSEPVNRQWDLDQNLKALGADGWEAYTVVASASGNLVFFFKRPVLIDPTDNG